MIIFYSLKTGEIVGTIEGRIHYENHLKAYIGSPSENGKIICQWEKVREWIDKDGDKRTDFEPDHPQKDIFIELDKNPFKVYDYKIDIKTKSLTKK